MERLLTTKELGQALGVSESSVKRWADDGTIRATRTAGGHRRITRADAIRFIRATHAPVAAPELLGLADVGIALSDSLSAGTDAERLLTYLRTGAAASARGLIQALYLQGEEVAAIIDGPLRQALETIGELWQLTPDGIFVEHRATDICIEALTLLKGTFSHESQGPLALGGAPAGDPYLLPSLSVATVLAAEGYETVNLGADTPTDTLQRAAQQLRPRLVWVAAKSPASCAQIEADLTALLAALEPLGASLVIGGQAASELRLAPSERLHVGQTMAELAELARRLQRP